MLAWAPELRRDGTHTDIDAAQAIGDVEGAIRLSREGMNRFPRNPRFFSRLGVILLDSKSAPFEAYGPLLAASRLNPKDGIVQRRLGDALLEMRRYDEALARYELAGALSEPSWDLTVRRARALRALGRRDEALRVLETTRKWEHTHILGPISLRMRIEMLLESGRLSDSLAELQAMLATDLLGDEIAWARCTLARTLEQLGRTMESVRACSAAVVAAGNARAVPCHCTR
jgi:tetratricopeptide (TPR) repeat protein